jgi:TetR/AcrR family transcriptional repressor of nem operon
LGADNDRTDTRNALLRAGVQVLSERGWDAAGLQRVLDLCDVPKGSFYHYFASKEDFGLAVIDAYDVYIHRRLAGSLDDAALDVFGRVQGVVDAGKRAMHKTAYTHGCLVGNLGQELAGINPVLRDKLQEVMLRWESRMAACLQRGIDEGTLSATLDPLAAAGLFWIGWEGAVLRAKLARSGAPLDLFARGWFALLRNGQPEVSNIDVAAPPESDLALTGAP